MASGIFNIITYDNENIIFSLHITQNGIDRDLTNYNVLMQAKEKVQDTAVVIDFSFYMTITNAQGLIEINVPSSVVAALEGNEYVYDVLLETKATEDKRRILAGLLQIIPGVTQ